MAVQAAFDEPFHLTVQAAFDESFHLTVQVALMNHSNWQ